MASCPSCGSPRRTWDTKCPRCSDASADVTDDLLETSEHLSELVSGSPARRKGATAGARACSACGTVLGPGETRCRRCADAAAEAPTDDMINTADDLLALLEADERSMVPVATPIAGAPAVRVEIRSRPEYAEVPRGSDPIVRVLVDVTAEGPPLLDQATGPIAHLILLLDVSASMNHPDKYPVLTEALSGMLHELAAPGSPEVLVSVVLFAKGAKTLFRDVPASRLVPREVLARIDSSPLRFGRYTDFAGALKRAGRISVEQLRKQRTMPTRVCILTDGRPQDLVRTRHVMQRIASLPIDLDALAFGEDADVTLLQEMVSGGRGGTVKQVRSDTLVEAFDRIAETARRVVSNRALLDFQLAPGVVGSAAYRYRPGRHRFGEDAFDGGTLFHTDLGTVESGRTYSLLFELRLPETAARETPIGRITLRLRGPGAPRVFESEVSVPRTADAALPAPDPDVVAASEVLAALSGADPKTQLSALRVRRKLYVAERRDPHIVAVIDKAIASLEREGSLAALSVSEQATLKSHTCTAGGMRPAPSRREFVAG